MFWRLRSPGALSPTCLQKLSQSPLIAGADVALRGCPEPQPTQGVSPLAVRRPGWLQGTPCWLTPTVGDTVQQVAAMAEALEASWRVDTYVVTGSVKGALIYIWKSRDSGDRVCLGAPDPRSGERPRECLAVSCLIPTGPSHRPCTGPQLVMGPTHLPRPLYVESGTARSVCCQWIGCQVWSGRHCLPRMRTGVKAFPPFSPCSVLQCGAARQKEGAICQCAAWHPLRILCSASRVCRVLASSKLLHPESLS